MSTEKQQVYNCGQCGCVVYLTHANHVYRPCMHEKAPVIANMEAVAYGESRLA